MSDTDPRHPLARMPIVYRAPAMADVLVRHDLAYGADDHTFDLYTPPRSDTPLGVVVLVSGFPDIGVPQPLGCPFKGSEVFISLARAIAAAGLAAVTYRAAEPAPDLQALRAHLAREEQGLGLDVSGRGLGFWGMSGHGPLALAAGMDPEPGRPAALVLSNAYTMDLEGSAVADAATTWRFTNGTAGRALDELGDVPVFVVRSGQDECPGLNDALDRFAAAAVQKNLPVVMANHPTAPHTFEMHDDSERSRWLIGAMLSFLASRLGA